MINAILTTVLVLLVTTIITLVYQAQKDRALQFQRQKQLLASIRKIQNENRALFSGAIGLGQRIHQLEFELNQHGQRQQYMQLHQVQLGNYSHASTLLKMGASAEQIKSSCGLSQSEVDFIMSMG